MSHDRPTEADLFFERRERETHGEPDKPFTESEKEVMDLLHHERGQMGDSEWANLFLSLAQSGSSRFQYVSKKPCAVTEELKLAVERMKAQRKALKQ